jgi:hypothetical protein
MQFDEADCLREATLWGDLGNVVMKVPRPSPISPHTEPSGNSLPFVFRLSGIGLLRKGESGEMEMFTRAIGSTLGREILP